MRIVTSSSRALLPLAAAMVAAAILATAACTRRTAPGSTAGAAEPSSGIAAVNGARIAYEISGRGPVVVLVHGGGFDRRLWDDQLQALADGYRVLRYDVRGAGRSTAPDTLPFGHHEDLAALLRHLRIERATVVGQSLGARIAVDLALAHPSLVRGLVLVGPGLGGWPWAVSDFGPWLEDFRADLLARDTARTVAAWLARGYMAAGSERPEIRARIERLATDNVGLWFDPSQDTELAPAALGRLEEVRAPTLVVVGTRDLPVIARIADTLAARVRGARLVRIEGAGHAPNLERPAEFNRLLLEFLAR